MQVTVTQTHRHAAEGLGAQHPRQALDGLHDRQRPFVDKGDGGVLPVGPEEGGVDHVLDRIQRKQCDDQQRHRHGNAKDGQAGAHGKTDHMAQRHHGELGNVAEEGRVFEAEMSVADRRGRRHGDGRRQGEHRIERAKRAGDGGGERNGGSDDIDIRIALKDQKRKVEEIAI